MWINCQSSYNIFCIFSYDILVISSNVLNGFGKKSFCTEEKERLIVKMINCCVHSACKYVLYAKSLLWTVNICKWSIIK